MTLFRRRLAQDERGHGVPAWVNLSANAPGPARPPLQRR